VALDGGLKPALRGGAKAGRVLSDPASARPERDRVIFQWKIAPRSSRNGCGWAVSASDNRGQHLPRMVRSTSPSGGAGAGRWLWATDRREAPLRHRRTRWRPPNSIVGIPPRPIPVWKSQVAAGN